MQRRTALKRIFCTNCIIFIKNIDKPDLFWYNVPENSRYGVITERKYSMKKTKFLSAVAALGMAFAVSASAASYVYDFEEAYEGDSLSYLDICIDAGWEEHNGSPSNSSFTVVSEDNGNKYVTCTGFVDYRSAIIEEEYVYSLDIRGSEHLCNEGLAGFFIRSSNPNNYSITHNGNPGTANWDMKFNFYESDWYKEAGGQDGNSGIGGSGIHIAPMANGVRLVVKRYVADGTTVANKDFTLAYPDGASWDNFANYKFRDNGETIEILVNNTTIATIELSNPGVTYEGDGNVNNDEYYGKAVIKDAAGAELGTIENTRICSSSSMLAIGVRTSPVDFDNVNIHTGEGVIESDKNGTLISEPEDTEDSSTNAPDADDETNASAGAATDAATNAQTNAADSDSTSGDEKGGISGGIIAIIAVAVVAVIGVAVVFLKKKK